MDTGSWAQELGISKEAVDLYAASEVIDLHLDSFIWDRILGYDIAKRNGTGLLGRSFYGHADFPRALEAGLTGGTWIITTNPLRSAGGRRRAFEKNLQRLLGRMDLVDGIRHVRTAAEYKDARAAGEHGAFIGIQGGNALDESLDALDLIADQSILRITLVHYSRSRIGNTSAPWSSQEVPLTAFGADYVRRLNELRIGVDLAHISRRGFFDAVEVHDKTQPLFVTHTGLTEVHDVWRNITDAQLRAVAETGGVVGVIFQCMFLGRRPVGVETVVDHVAHIVDTVGEDHASIGTDYDGAITPPKDLPGPRAMPRLVQEMLDRGWSVDRIQKVLGGNALRAIAQLRG